MLSADFLLAESFKTGKDHRPFPVGDAIGFRFRGRAANDGNATVE